MRRKNEIVVPLGSMVVLAKKPKRPARTLGVIARGLWSDPEALVREEAASWERTAVR